MQALFLCNTWDLSSLCACGHISCVRLFVMLWTVALQTPLSMGFSRQEYWSGSPCPLPGNLPDLGIEPASLMSSELADGFFTTSATWEAPPTYTVVLFVFCRGGIFLSPVYCWHVADTQQMFVKLTKYFLVSTRVSCGKCPAGEHKIKIQFIGEKISTKHFFIGKYLLMAYHGPGTEASGEKNRIVPEQILSKK